MLCISLSLVRFVMCAHTERKDTSQCFFQDDRTKTPVLSGIKLRRGELEHFDVFLPAEGALGQKIIERFGIDVATSNRLDHLEALRLERASQGQMSTADVLSCAAAADAEVEEQTRLLKDVSCVYAAVEFAGVSDLHPRVADGENGFPCCD